MLSTSIGAVTLEMDNKLTSLLKEVDKAGVDVSNPKELLRAAKELASESIQGPAGHRQEDREGAGRAVA